MKDEDDDDEESVGTTRYPTLPSLVALQQMRNRLHMAHDGKHLMKWSAMATGRELRRVAMEIGKIYSTFTEDVRTAYILLARCRYFYPNMNKMVIEGHPQKACVTVGRTLKSIAGCRVQVFQPEENCPDSYPCLGIDKGGETITEAKKAWRELLLRMIAVEQLRSNFMSLDESHRNANKKSNVLGKIIIPRTDLTIRYILSELEELEREEFFRLKKVLEIKYRGKKNKKKDEEAKKDQASADSKKPVPACSVCAGPMRRKPLTEKEIEQEKAAIVKLKETLSKVESATKEYEKTTSKPDAFKEFKQTASDLREKLSFLPAKSITIPDTVDVNTLCDSCKEVYNEKQANAICIICGELLIPKDDKTSLAVRESKRQLQQELDELLALIRDYESTGTADDKIKDFKKKAAELKNQLQGPPIPKNVDVNELCNACKERLNKPVEPEPELVVIRETSRGQETPKKKESKVSIKEPSTTTTITTVTEQQTPQASDLPLGVFETEEITEVIQIRNPDGTVAEKRRTVTIVRKQGALADQSGSRTPSNTSTIYKDKKTVGVVTIMPQKAFIQKPRHAKSDSAIRPVTDREIRRISSTFDFGSEEVLESVTEFTPMHNDTKSDVVSVVISDNGTANYSNHLRRKRN